MNKQLTKPFDHAGTGEKSAGFSPETFRGLKTWLRNIMYALLAYGVVSVAPGSKNKMSPEEIWKLAVQKRPEIGSLLLPSVLAGAAIGGKQSFDFTNHYAKKEAVEQDKYENLLPVIAEQRKHNLENPQETDFGNMEKAEYRKPLVSPDGTVVALMIKIDHRRWLVTDEKGPGENKINLYPAELFKKLVSFNGYKGKPRVNAQGKITHSFIDKSLVRDDRGGWAGWDGAEIKEIGWTQTVVDGKPRQVIQYAGMTDEGLPFRAWRSVEWQPDGRRILSPKIVSDRLKKTLFSKERRTTEKKDPRPIDKKLIAQVKEYLRAEDIKKTGVGSAQNSSDDKMTAER
jgi:hypothetical protein